MKISQKILTLLLVVAMVFGVSATTISALTADISSAEGGNSGNGSDSSKNEGVGTDTESKEDGTASDSYISGWCDIHYEGSDITVILSPDKEALLDMTKEDFKEIAKFLAEAVKEIVLNDLIKDVLPNAGESDTLIDPDTVWFDALDSYLGKKYGDDVENKYVEFLKAAINDEQELHDFAKYACSLVKAAVLSGAVELEDLPAKDNIEEEISKILNDYVDSYIDSYLDKVVDGYIDNCINGTVGSGEFDAMAEEYLVSYAREALENYIKSLKGEATSSSDFQIKIEEYAEDYITEFVKDAVSEYVQAKVEGNDAPANTVNNYIEDFITDEISARVDTYIENKLSGTAPTDDIDKLVDEYAGEYINDYIKDVVADYIDAKVKGTELADNVVNAYIKDFVDDEIGRHVEIYIANKLAGNEPTDDVDKIVTDYADAYVKDYVADALSDYIAAKVNNTELPDNDVNAYIEDFLVNEIGNRVDKYIANKVAGTEPTEEIDILVAEYADEYLNDYVNGAFDDYINAKFGDGTIDASLKSLIDEEIKAYFDDYYNDQTEAYKTYVLNGRVGEKPALYDVIEPKVKDAVIAEIMNGDPAIDNAAALEIYEDPAFEISDYLADINFADYKEEAIASLVEADYRDAFATVDVDELAKKVLSDTELKDSIRADINVDDVIASIGTENADAIIATVDIDAVLKDALADEGFKATIKSEINPDEVLASIDPENADNISKIIATVDVDAVLNEALKDEKVQKLIRDELNVDDILVHIGTENAQKIIDTVNVEEILESVSDEKRAEIVEEMYNEYTDADIVEMVTDIIKNLEKGTLDTLIAEMKDLVMEKVESGELDEEFVERFGIKISEARDEIVIVAEIIGSYYSETITELEEAPKGAKRYIALLELVNDITVDGVSIYGNSENGKVFYRDRVEQILRDLPKFDEIENMEDGDMLLSYAFGVVTDFGDCNFSITVKAGGGFDTIRKIAAIINRNVIYSIDENYNIVLDVNVPEELAKAILKACETGKISDELKNKVFEKISYNGEELYAFVNSVSLDTLIALLDEVNLDNILDSEFVSRFEKLDGLTADEIKEKIKTYEKYYNKALEIMRKVYAKLPADLTAKSLFDIYNSEEGNFNVNYDYDVNLADLAFKVNETLANYLEAFIDNLSFSGSINATVTIEDLYKVTYIAGGNIVREGFLPVGANVAFFSGLTQFEGDTVIGWTDISGKIYETMPESDIVLYALTKEATAILNATATEIIYGEGNSIVLTAIPALNIAPTEVVYTWYKDGAILEGVTGSELTLTEVVESGSYYCVITVTDAYGTNELVTNSVEIDIKPIEIDIENAVTWDYDPTKPFIYNDKAQGVEYIIGESYAALIKFASIEGNSAKDAGEYKAVAYFTLVDDSNYVFVNGDSVSCEWVILPYEYDEDDLIWDGEFEFEYKYETTHTVKAPTAPVGLTVSISDNTATDAGEYIAKVTVTAEKNYKWAGAEVVEKSFKVTPQAIDLSGFEWKTESKDTDTNESKFTFEYTGKAQKVYIDGLPADIAAAVKYTDNEATDVTGKTLTAKAEIDYTGTKIADNYAITGAFATQDWEIVKVIIDLGKLTWTAYDNLTYNGNEHKPTLVGLPEDDRLSVVYKYYVEKSGAYEIASTTVNAGNYKAVVELSAVDTNNFAVVGDFVDSVEYCVNKATIQLTVSWNYDSANPFVYNGSIQKVSLKTIANTRIEPVKYINNQFENAGEYTATATIALKANYAVNYDLVINGKKYGSSADLTLDWVINKKTVTLPELSWTQTALEFTGAEQSVMLDTSAVNKADLDAVNIVYTGNKATAVSKDPYQATAAISLKDSENYEFASGVRLNYSTDWQIAKRVISLGKLNWIIPGKENSTYTGSPIAHPTLDLSGVSAADLELIKAPVYNHVFGDPQRINAGKYKIIAAIESIDPEKYAVDVEISACEWEIFKAEYNLEAEGVDIKLNVLDGKEITLENPDQIAIDYDGLYHTLTLGTCVLPEGLSIDRMKYTGNTQKDVGTHTVVVTFFSDDPNYSDASKLFHFIIKGHDDTSTSFNEGNVFVGVDTPLSNKYELDIHDHVETLDISVVAPIVPVDKIGEFVAAYDINFVDENGNVIHDFENNEENEGITGYNFSVTITIPTELAYGNRTLMVVHLEPVTDPNGGVTYTLEVVENARRIGNKMQFDVTHFSIYAVVEIKTPNAPVGPDLPSAPGCNYHYDIDLDGKCDNCNADMILPEDPDEPDCDHVDNNEDGKCDICDEDLTVPDCEHEDADGDGFCDKCGEEIEPDVPTTDDPTDCEHEDADGDGYCDNCGEEIEPDDPTTDDPTTDDPTTDDPTTDDPTTDDPTDCEHKDNNNDGYCDNCGERVEGADAPDKDFYFSTDDGSVDIFVDGGVNEGITLGVTDVTEDHLDVDLSAILKNGYKGEIKVAYDINFLDGDVVTALSGRFVVRLLIPEALRTPASRDLRVVYIAPDATVTELASSRSGDYLIFETDHFSVYSIIEVTPDGTVVPPEEVPSPLDPISPDEDESSLIWLWIIIIVLVVAAAAAAVFFFLKRRNDGGNTDPDEPAVVAPVAPVVEEPEAEEPVAEEPVVEEPVAEEPVAEEPAVEEPVVEEAVVEEPVAVEAPVAEEAKNEFVPPVAASGDDDDATGKRLVNGQIVPVRYRTSFMSRLIQSEPPIQDYYTAVKNTLLSYEGVKARTSWNFESFNKGRIQCAKLNVKGNAFQVYLGLDPNEYSVEKYHFVDVSDKPKLDKVPMMIKVKSDRALKYSIELIEEVMNKNGIAQGEIPSEDYHLPYESTEALVDRDLVKIILPEGMVIDENTVIERINVGDFLKDVAPEEEIDESKFVHVDAEVADTMMSDEEAQELIENVAREIVRKSKTNKLVEINIDTICANYENGETVDIKNLQEKNLVSKKADRVKVLARGVMTKRLTVVADKFSIQAVKMIGLAGGHAKKYKD